MRSAPRTTIENREFDNTLYAYSKLMFNAFKAEWGPAKPLGAFVLIAYEENGKTYYSASAVAEEEDSVPWPEILQSAAKDKELA